MPVKGNMLTYWKANAGLSSEAVPTVPMICKLPAHSQTLKALCSACFFASKRLKGEITESYLKSLEKIFQNPVFLFELNLSD